MLYWDERVAEMAKRYLGVTTDKFHIDILRAHFTQRPGFFDVVVPSNLFGDILSDLDSACTGTIGIPPSANLNPTRIHASLFEPVHGFAPDLAGHNIAKPIEQIWCGGLMLYFQDTAMPMTPFYGVVEQVLQSESGAPRTADLGGTATTTDVGRAIAEAI